MILALFIAGILLVIVGASLLVRGAADLAVALGTPPLLIGLTIVAFGTSSPELVVSVQAALAGEAEIALGNVVGSNIFNVLFILGLSALVAPLMVSAQVVRRDVPIMIGVSVLALVLTWNGRIGPTEGVLLMVGIVVYTAVQVRLGLRDRSRNGRVAAMDPGRPPAANGSLLGNLALIVVGLVVLWIGSRWLVDGAIEIAQRLGVSQLVIGLTIVAAGTSLPEAATSVAASLRGERDIAVGNVVGSNIFNILFVLGAAAIAAPNGIIVPPPMLTFDLPVMIAVAVACLPVFFSGYEIKRWEGAVFLGYYAAYTAFLILDATKHSALPVFGGVMLLFILPITVLTLTVISVRAWRSRSVARDRPGGGRP